MPTHVSDQIVPQLHRHAAAGAIARTELYASPLPMRIGQSAHQRAAARHIDYERGIEPAAVRPLHRAEFRASVEQVAVFGQLVEFSEAQAQLALAAAAAAGFIVEAGACVRIAAGAFLDGVCAHDIIVVQRITHAEEPGVLENETPGIGRVIYPYGHAV